MDRRRFLLGATSTVGAFTLLGPASGCAPAPPVAAPGYRLVWNDEFDVLDTSVWQPEPWHAQDFDWSKVSVANSILTLTADLTQTPAVFTTLASIGPRAAARPFHPSAKVWQEGYFEIRVRATKSPWTKLAIWFMSHETANCWPEPRNCWIPNSEWDMVENGVRAGHAGASAYADVQHASFVHRNTSDECGAADSYHRYLWDAPSGGLCDWHVWSGRWTATELTTYLDGQQLGSQPVYPDSTPQPMYMLLTAAPLGSVLGNPPKPAIIQTQVDYVRVWQR
jgi:hypothetical protein